MTDLAVLDAVENLNRSVELIGLLLFGQQYTDTLEQLGETFENQGSVTVAEPDKENP